MDRLDLIDKIQKRRKILSISLENLAKISNISMRTINRFLAGDDVKLSTVEKVTKTLGLDFAGNEIVNIKDLRKRRAEEKAIFLASIVQGTSTLEMQGLEKNSLGKIISSFKEEFLSGQYKDRLWVA